MKVRTDLSRIVLAMLLIACLAMRAAAQERQTRLPGETTLIIVASQSGERYDFSEFIVLRSSKASLLWTATASMRDEPKEGRMKAGTVDLAKVFERIEGLEKKEAKSPDTKHLRNTFYSLLLIDDHGARTCQPLNRRQQLELGSDEALRGVFDDILRNSSYAKANIMLDLVLRPGALRATAGIPPKPSARQSESVYPPFHGGKP